MRVSEVTFRQAVNSFAYIAIKYNNKIIYDDSWWDEDHWESVESINTMLEEYGNKKIYYMSVEIVEFHHAVIHIEGE